MINRLVSLSCVLLLGGGLLAGCSAANESSDSGGSAAAPAAGPDSGTGFSGSDSGGKADTEAVKPADVARAAAAPAAGAARLVRTAEITIEVKDVGQAARAIRTTATALGGVVSTENTEFPGQSNPEVEPNTKSEDSGDSQAQDQRSQITLRVPEPRMDDALTRIAATGHEVDRSTTSDDVTATIVDLDSRVATQTKSVARVRQLLDRAASLQDVVLLEGELSRREADLESIQARQRALVDKAALSTITVTLRNPGAVAEEPEEAGFMTGLNNGWDALIESTSVVLTVIGALLPITVVLLVIGIPIAYLRRRFRSTTPPPAHPQSGPWPPAAPEPPAGPGSPAAPEPASAP
jgi:hypothetical protein